jgi:hypothetical protein
MSERLTSSVLRLALRKSDWRTRLTYLARGFAFLPFLWFELAQSPLSGGTAAKSAAGDDIYPVF